MHVCICVHVQMLVGVGPGEGDSSETEQIKPREEDGGEEDHELRDVREEGKKVTRRRIPK